MQPVMLMSHAKITSDEATQVILDALANGASFDTVPRERPGLWFQDLVRLGYFTKHHQMIGDNVADIDYRNVSPIAIMVDGKQVPPGAFVEW